MVMVKLIPWVRGNKPQYNKTDAILLDGVIVGEVEFAYGRSDSAEAWGIWDVKVRIFSKGVAFIPHFIGRNYKWVKEQVLEEVQKYFETETVNLKSEFCNLEDEAYGTCATLTRNVLHGADMEDEIFKIKQLKYPFHEKMKKRK